MSDLRDMRYETETIDQIILEPYTGTRYGGMSDDVVFVRLTIAYRFDNFDVIVKAVPAKWDRETVAEYLSGKIGRDIYDHVERVANSLLRQQTHDDDPAGMTDSKHFVRHLEREIQALAAMIGDAPKRVSINPDLAA